MAADIVNISCLDVMMQPAIRIAAVHTAFTVSLARPLHASRRLVLASHSVLRQ
jgi:hypothetical protein